MRSRKLRTIKPYEPELFQAVIPKRSHRGDGILPGTNKDKVYRLMRNCGNRGLTDYEAAEILKLEPKQVTPRFSEIRHLGLARRTECIRGSRRVWIAVEEKAL